MIKINIENAHCIPMCDISSHEYYKTNWDIENQCSKHLPAMSAKKTSIDTEWTEFVNISTNEWRNELKNVAIKFVKPFVEH